MSIVGIRPLLPEELALRSERDQMLYRMLRPGMTGLWQVEGRSHVEQVDRVGLDRTYIESWSLGSDLWIMLRTPFALLKVGNTH
jgi:lipopolysaccharide/colanic/teichoic acid biosynthesis glycosyltransferase